MTAPSRPPALRVPCAAVEIARVDHDVTRCNACGGSDPPDALTQAAIERAAPLARAASNRALAAGRPAEAAFLAHLEGCIGWCRECPEFLKAVDVEDGKRLGWPDGWEERKAARMAGVGS